MQVDEQGAVLSAIASLARDVGQVIAGVAGTNVRLDKVNGRLDKGEDRFTVLERRLDARDDLDRDEAVRAAAERSVWTRWVVRAKAVFAIATSVRGVLAAIALMLAWFAGQGHLK